MKKHLLRLREQLQKWKQAAEELSKEEKERLEYWNLVDKNRKTNQVMLEDYYSKEEYDVIQDSSDQTWYSS